MCTGTRLVVGFAALFLQRFFANVFQKVCYELLPNSMELKTERFAFIVVYVHSVYFE